MKITRQIGWPLAGVVAASLLVAASGRFSPSAPINAQSLSVNYQWRNGTVAPPYHYEYSIEVDPGKNARMVMTLGYPRSDGQNTKWTESFVVSPAAREKLLQTMRSWGLFAGQWREAASSERPVGGGTENLEVRAGRRTFSIPAFLSTPKSQADASAIYAAINALVPKAARARLMAKQQKYQQQALEAQN